MGPRHDLSLCECKTASLESVLLVSIVPSPHQGFVHANRDFWNRITSLYWCLTSPVVFCMQNSVISIRITSLCGSQTSPVVYACKTAWLSSGILVSMGPSPHRCFLHANRDFWSRITSLYRSLTTPVVLYMQNSVISIRITSLCGSQTSPVVFACKTAWLSSELQISMGLWPHLSFCACKTAWLASELQVSVGPRPHLWFLHAKQRD